MKSWLRLPLVFLLIWCALRGAVFLLPGDPAEFLVHESLVRIEASELRKKMDLPESPLERMLSLPKNRSLVRNESAATLLSRAAGKSLVLTALTLFLAIPLTFLTLYLSFRRGRGRRISEGSVIVLASVPVFVAGPVFLRVFPLPNPILPALILALHLTAFWHRSLSRHLEASILKSSVPGARALGFSEFTVFRKHLLAPSFGYFTVFFGTQLGVLLNGSLLVETLFQWHGVGSLLADAVLSRDYPVIELTLMAVSVASLIAQQLGYHFQARLDPRAT